MAQDLLLVECVQTHVKVADVAQAWENDFFLEVDYSPGIRVEMINSPVKLSETPAVVRGVAPELGQHTEEGLQDLGYGCGMI